MKIWYWKCLQHPDLCLGGLSLREKGPVGLWIKIFIRRVYSWLVRVISEERRSIVVIHSSLCLACPPTTTTTSFLLHGTTSREGFCVVWAVATMALLSCFLISAYDLYCCPLPVLSVSCSNVTKSRMPCSMMGPVASLVPQGLHWGPLPFIWAVLLPLFCKGATHEWLQGGAYLMS